MTEFMWVFPNARGHMSPTRRRFPNSDAAKPEASEETKGPETRGLDFESAATILGDHRKRRVSAIIFFVVSPFHKSFQITQEGTLHPHFKWYSKSDIGCAEAVDILIGFAGSRRDGRAVVCSQFVLSKKSLSAERRNVPSGCASRTLFPLLFSTVPRQTHGGAVDKSHKPTTRLSEPCVCACVCARVSVQVLRRGTHEGVTTRGGTTQQDCCSAMREVATLVREFRTTHESTRRDHAPAIPIHLQKGTSNFQQTSWLRKMYLPADLSFPPQCLYFFGGCYTNFSVVYGNFCVLAKTVVCGIQNSQHAIVVRVRWMATVSYFLCAAQTFVQSFCADKRAAAGASHGSERCRKVEAQTTQ